MEKKLLIIIIVSSTAFFMFLNWPSRNIQKTTVIDSDGIVNKRFQADLSSVTKRDLGNVLIMPSQRAEPFAIIYELTDELPRQLELVLSSCSCLTAPKSLEFEDGFGKLKFSIKSTGPGPFREYLVYKDKETGEQFTFQVSGNLVPSVFWFQEPQNGRIELDVPFNKNEIKINRLLAHTYLGAKQKFSATCSSDTVAIFFEPNGEETSSGNLTTSYFDLTIKTIDNMSFGHNLNRTELIGEVRIDIGDETKTYPIQLKTDDGIKLNSKSMVLLRNSNAFSFDLLRVSNEVKENVVFETSETIGVDFQPDKSNDEELVYRVFLKKSQGPNLFPMHSALRFSVGPIKKELSIYHD